MKSVLRNLKSEIRNQKLADFYPPFFLLFLLVAFLVFIAASCKKEKIIPGSASYNYIPVTEGRYVVYDVDSVYHSDNDGNTDDSVYSWHFQLKELIGETFMDGQGQPVQIIRRYRRDADSTQWMEVGACTQLLSSAAMYRTEDNISYHKLAFPINTTIQWNGNDANTLDDEMYVYESVHSSLTMNAMNFDSTLSILEVDEDNFVEKIYGEEIYASQVGLIYRERDDLRKVNGLPVKGTEFRMRVRTYGIE
jgi:hypothetical protein